jgi:hypothetical protein
MPTRRPHVRALTDCLIASVATLAGIAVRQEESLRVEVREPDHGFKPSFPAPPESSGSGRGLLIVGRLADRREITREASTCVWFDIDGPRGSARGGGARRG